MSAVIISGGPGAGKTTLINALAQRGFRYGDEVSRRLIEEQQLRVDGILPWTDLPAFAALCLTEMQTQKEQALTDAQWHFLDRAIGDICAYLTVGGEGIPAHYSQAAQGYYGVVFVCPPQAQIYQQDAVRPHPFDEAQHIHQQLVHTYQQLDYQVVTVPWLPIEQRAQWVLDYLQQEQTGSERELSV
ncbi:hypothetical protein VST7929_00145 [Vibrio stylophorae]|uniref:NadR/Ttd14 AAA domain-containing protein n=1 Tax=Vibrio stylophorae TaxID=659351 RepID=A0ABM8ZQG6_9VIBR|nr:AAA family ATPase [Vibrio stylophorae]CAH0532327.1 hypothetical protein VST7929_00145 [Vibrio stylophorae]